ncbi:hypothetical protein [Nitrospira sp. Kam-Ns4a]
MEPSRPAEHSAEPDPGPDKEPKLRKELPLVSVPDDRALIEEEMAELFEEDQVTHQHGSTEPEGD